MMKYIDIHGHVNFSAYENDRDQVIKRSLDAGVAVVIVGTQYDTSSLALDIAKKHNNTYAIVGLHPIHTSKSHHDEQEFGEGNKGFTSRGEELNFVNYHKLAMDNKVIAIGESGLDFYHIDNDFEIKQFKVFESMIDLANTVSKPIMLHLRNGSGRSAYLEAFQILKNKSKVCGDLHFFAGSIEEAKPFLDMGFYFSFTGVITFTNSYDEIIKYLPLDRIMTETDCPYVSPIPFRGKRNEPVNVREVVKRIAQIKNIEEELVRIQVMNNAVNFFGISL